MRYTVSKSYWAADGETFHSLSTETGKPTDEWALVLDAFINGDVIPDTREPEPLRFDLAEVLTGTRQWMSDGTIIDAVRRLKEAQG